MDDLNTLRTTVSKLRNINNKKREYLLAKIQL